MDYDHPDWAATALFSPSKARQQQALAKDWSFVDNWLSKKYHPKPVPKFERNDETLQALLALAAFSEKADEEQELVERLEQAALVELEREDEEEAASNPLNRNIQTSLRSSLTQTGQSDLTSHTTTAIQLNSTTTNAAILANSILSLTTTLFSLTQQLSRVDDLHASLLRQQSLLETELQDLRSPAFAADPNLPQRTAESNRQTKTLRAKLQEYDDRLRNGGANAVPEQALKDVEVARGELDALMQSAKGVESKIAAFEGLPPEPREVRRVLEGLRRDLEMWVAKRDELFEGLMEGGRR